MDCSAQIIGNINKVVRGEGSPKILLGSINLGVFPNFHAVPLLETGASVVALTHDPEVRRPDLLYCAPWENLASVLHRLPQRWTPDFFLDLQVEQGHWLPIGLSECQFKSVVTVNHAHLGQALWHMQGMFDCVVMPSPMMAPWGDAWLPWSGSWGTMDQRITMFPGSSYDGSEKTVTVSSPVSRSGFAKESTRHLVAAEMERIKARRPDWTVAVAEGLDQTAYFQLLARSKVVVNVGTWGSPVSYRPLEAIAQQAILVHVDEQGYGSSATISEVFERDWYVDALPETLEDAIEVALTRVAEAGKIKAEVEERYSYRAQYARLFEIAETTPTKPRLSLREWSRRAFAINALTGYVPSAQPHAWALMPDDLYNKPGYREGVNLWQPTDPETRYRFQTELALRRRDPKEIYEEYACAP